MYLRDTLRLPAKGLRPSAHPFFISLLEHGALTWINIERPGLAEMTYLKERYDFHQLALDDCLSISQIPKLDAFDDYLFLVLHFPIFSHESRLTPS